MTTKTSQQGKYLQFDVLVIGTGLAGQNYCLELLKLQPKLKIGLISKAEIAECNSRYAQGGIAAAVSAQDSLKSHIADTLQAGDGLCFQPAVEAIISKGPEAIQLLQSYSVNFSKLADGEFSLAQEGGHSHRRILHSSDHTGLTVTEALIKAIQQHPQIHIFEHHIAINLISYYHPHRTDNQGEVLGAYVLDCQQSRFDTFAARCVVLATGGAGKTYRYTTNPMVATGDGVAMAYHAGARVGNMEFYQFHPTVLHHPTLNNFLISEAVRGEGGLLKNAETGERFMKRYAAEHLELATRDVVARAIFNEIEQGESGFVYLDIRHQSKSFLKAHFPQIFTTLLSIGIDMSQDLIPVVPAAHYQCGGVLTDVDGRTDLKRLYAIGEVAFTGLHGANRLASNSLLEALVVSSNAARCSLKDIQTPCPEIETITSFSPPGEINTRRASQINAHWRGLRSEMTSYAGIVRTEAGLQDLLQLVMKRKKIIEEYYWKHCITRDFIELRNIVLNAELIIRASLTRRESRGGHYREDFPNKNTFAQESIARLTSPQTPFI
ncbi:MAG: L-aspartate oxidase [Tatlockia sp.]|nr:L-aspartate oxidase [Tatlockia sp.]